ncbi:MAG: hypothetical protein ACO1QR_08830, partial [Chthoniobacteraceae bacterium]
FYVAATQEHGVPRGAGACSTYLWLLPHSAAAAHLIAIRVFRTAVGSCRNGRAFAAKVERYG